MIRVGIVDDHAIIRFGLRELLGQHTDIRVVGEVPDARQAIDLARTQSVDVLLLDLAMPHQNAIDVLAVLHAVAPEMAILVLSGYPAEHFALNLLRQGVLGFLSKGGDQAEIVEAIRVVSRGRRYITPAVAELLTQQLHDASDALPHEKLSSREWQVFLQLARGQTVNDIADALSLSVKTVSTYRTRVMEKVGLHSNSDLTYYALKNHLID
jgi:DNA-binding NarL/FixJ family response regulator